MLRYAAFSIFFVATLWSSETLAEQPPGCTLSQPPIYNLVGSDQKSRYQAVKGGATLLNSFLVTQYNKKVKESVESAMQKPVADAANALKWSKEKGAVIEVVMERDSNQNLPARLLLVSFVGVGSCMYDVLVAHWSQPQLYPSPDPGFKVDDDTSFFAWETYADRKPTIHVDVPGSRGPILDRVRADGETAKLLSDRASFDEGKRLLALADQSKAMEGNLAAIKEIDDAAKIIRDSQQKRSEIDAALKTALFEQSRLQEASDSTASFERILSLASLASNAIGMLSSSNLSQEEKLKIESAKSADDIKGVIATKITETQTRIEYEQGQYKLIQQTYQKSKSYIVDKAKANGAPGTILP